MTEDFIKLLRFRTISAEKNNPQMRACVSWLQNFLESADFRTEVWTTSTYPALFAEKIGDPKWPTLLFYNHYDVQPVDPLAEWASDPFEPRIEGDNVYARGAQDNKGQLFYVLQALRSWKGPVNVKVIIEGDEEMGSDGLKGILQEKRSQLQADGILITDLGIKNMREPAITLGTRGLLCMELMLKGSNRDLHSGEWGGIAFNPLHALVQMLAALRTLDGRIQIPGFYDGVQVDDVSMSLSEEECRQEFGLLPTGGERAFSPAMRGTARPTLEINGISGGFGGEGFKTVIPAKALAKLSCRLVPGQDPDKIFSSLEKTLQQQLVPGIEMRLERINTPSKAVRTKSDSFLAQAAKKAYEKVLGYPCQEILCGATIGLIEPLREVSSGDVLLHGLALPSDNIHAPNEHFSLSRLSLGKKIVEEILQYVANM